MLKRMITFVVTGMLMMSLSGCFALFLGAAGGAGTAVWLSGKLTQEFHSSYHATIDATKLALQSLNLPLLKETRDENITQLKSAYSDGSEMWIDIHRVSDESTKVEVRVGGVTSNKEAAGIVLRKIQDFL